MKRFRFNTKVGTSRGLGTYRNKGSDYLELAPKYRTLYESERTDVISRSIIYIGGGDGYVDMSKVWAKIDFNNRSVFANIWDKDYWMHERVEFWNYDKINQSKKVYSTLVLKYGKDFFDNRYIPVCYDNKNAGISKDFSAFANHLTHDVLGGGYNKEFYNFAFRRLEDGRGVLYARYGYLKNFQSGCDIINYYRMAKARRFEEVYGF
jgi:hypothetical protein